MSIARKKRSDRKLNALTPEQEGQLCDSLLSGVPYWKALEMVRKDFGISVGKSALEQFYQDVCVPELLSRQQRARMAAQSIEAEAKKRPGEWDEATTAAVQQLAFDTVTRGGSAEDVAMVVDLVIKMRKQEIDRERLKLDRNKYQRETCKLFITWCEDAKAKEIATNSGLSESQKVEKLGQFMFGDLWDEADAPKETKR